MGMLLQINNLTIYYGKALAVENANLAIPEEAAVSLIGANGAGKTTILRAISGLIPITSGEIRFMGKKIDGMSVPEIVRHGLVHVPQGRKLFPFLTVLSNLKLGTSLRKDKLGIQKDMEQVFEYFPVLKSRLNQKAGTLSGGEQEMLAIGRGLMAKPKLLMLDEPSLGLAPAVIDQLGLIIESIHESGVSVLLVEQNVSLAFRVASRGYVLEVGTVILQGDIQELRSNELVKRAYLGE